jgi:Tol biopolymer transport system component
MMRAMPRLGSGSRGSIRTVLAALLCVGTAACSQLSNAAGLSSPAGNPEPATAIVLTIPTDAIYLVDPSTGHVLPIVTDLVGIQAGYATWSAGHTALAYGNGGIRSLDPSKLTSTLLIGGSTVSMPAFSPRGSSLAFGDGVHMDILSVSGSSPQPQPGPTPTFTQVDLPNTLGPAAFDWVTAKQIVFQGTQLDCSNPERCLATSTSDIWTVHADGSGLTQVTSTGDAGSPKWAPAGRQILYVRSSSRKGFGSQLWAANPDGTSPHRLILARNVVAADWSPDGEKLVVIRLNAITSTLEIWIGKGDGTNLQQVGDTLPGTDATVDW